MILINFQIPIAFAGACEDKDRDGYYIESAPAYCGNGAPRDCDDTDPDIYPGQGECPGSGGVTITEDVDDNFEIGPGDFVIISNGAAVAGNLEVNGGTLLVTGSSIINGNIEGSNGAIIRIEDGSTLNGNVEIVLSGSGSTLEIVDSNLNGNIETNSIDSLIITGAYVNGNILSDNDGNVTITNNDVNGNMAILSPVVSCSESGNNVNGNNSGCP